MRVRYSTKHTINHRKFLTFLAILVLLVVSQFSVFQFVPSVKAQETSSIVDTVGTEINWTEFWQTFKTYAAWDLEWLDRTIWRSIKSDLIVVLNYSKPNHCKVSLVFDASHNAAYRLTFVINRVVTDYVERLDKFQYELTYDDVTIIFDWTDCASISGLVFTHGLIDDVFWFRLRRNNVPLGSHVVIDPSVIASTSTNYAVSYSNQRKTFTAYSKHWVFFSNGSYAVYYYSSDGNTWTMGNDSPLRAATYGYMFSVWWTGDESGTYINFAYAYSAGALNQPLLFRRGKLLANSTILWDAAEQTVLAADASLYYACPFVCMGIDLYPWIGYRRYEKSVATTPYVVRSSSYSGSWSTPSGFPYQLSTWTSTSWIVTISPLTNTQYSGAKAVFYSNSSSKINCQSWTAVVWNSAVQTSSSIGTSWYLSASAIGNITHLVFLSSLNNKKYTYYNYTSNTFASETSLGIGAAVDNAPVISVNSTSNDIWVMWADSPSSVSQFYYKLFNNSISSWGSDINYFNETIIFSQDKLISPYKFTGKFGIAYLNGTSSFSVNFVLVEVVVITKAWYDVSTWTASLNTRTWSSGTSWTANLIARMWSSGTSWSFNLLTRQWNSILQTEGISPSVVGASTSNVASEFTFQLKSFYANSLFWVFFSNGTNFVFSTSTDGATWSAATNVRTSSSGQHSSVWFDGTYAHYTCTLSIINSPLFYRRGTPNPDGTITWSATEQNAMPTNATVYYFSPYVSVDSNGYPFIAFRQYDGIATLPIVIKSSTNDGTWSTDTGFPYQLSTTDDAWRDAVVPLSSGKMLAIYVANTVNVKSWDGSVWGTKVTTASNAIYGAVFSIVAQGDDAHITFTKSTGYDIIYVKYTYATNSFGAETTLQTVASTSTNPVISIDTSNNLYVFWAGYPTANHIYYRKWNGAIWETAVDWITEINLTGNDRITCFYNAFEGYIGLVYMTETASPYNIKFAGWWQSPMSFAFNLLAGVWTDIATWVYYPITRLFIDIVVWTFNETAMMWRDLTWLFTLLPSLPEWVNVAVWIFSLRSPEWMLVALWNLQLEAAGVIASLFIAILLLIVIVIVAGIIAVAYRRPKR